MLYSTTLFVAGLAGVAIASPLSIRDENPFIAGAWWDIILDDTATLDQMKEANGSVIDIDLFDNADKGIIKDLAKDKTVICYFSAGSKEEWRDDASEFQPGDTGAPLIKDEDDQTVWDNETWVNVKSESVRAIMKKRIEYAAESGCNAVDPDNVDGYVSTRSRYGRATAS
jgi:hypothetical protein